MTEASERGSLHIATKVVERIAEIASGEVQGVTKSGTGISSVFGRSFPRVNAEVAGDRAVLDIEVASTWPHNIPELTNAVASSVRSQLQFCASVEADQVNVHVGHVEKAKMQRTARVQ